MYDDAYTRDNDGKLAVRTVSTTGDTSTNVNDVFTRDNDGKLCLRTTGEGGGGGSVDKNKIINKSTSLPTPNANNLGQVYMYDGESNALYTHGYIYQVVAEKTATDVIFSGNIITSWAVSDFVRYLQEGGSGYNEVVRGTLTYDESGGLWDLVGYDENGIEVLKFHEYTEDLVDFGCVFTSETHQDGETCSFTLTTIDDGYKWKRVDVQPAGGTTGNVSSVNGKTGAVVLGAKDVNAVPQYSTMPTASASNVGEIAQYSGETIPSSPASATIEQTTGSGLTNLAVNLETFVAAEQPSGAEDVEFTASVGGGATLTTLNVPSTLTIVSTNAATFRSFIETEYGSWDEDWTQGTFYYTIDEGWYVMDINDTNDILVGFNLSTAGITATGTVEDSDSFSFMYSSVGSIIWEKDSETVDLATYGISYSGTPSNGDVLTVSYLPGVVGIDNGYFYKCIESEGPRSATISQTTGNTLSNLAVDLATFEAEEQPSTSETVTFTAVAAQESVSTRVLSGEISNVSINVANLRTVVEDEGYDWDDSWLNGLITHIYDPEEGTDEWEVSTSDEAYIMNILDVSSFLTFTGSEEQWIDIEYTITSAGTVEWTKNNVTVDVADYGITYSGTPSNGDVITVVYTVGSNVYNWEQLDVQPASGGAGIEWKTTVDLPANYQPVANYAGPVFTIRGGLPDGDYEFYYQKKNTDSTNQNRPFGLETFAYRINVTSGRVTQGIGGFVVDGNWIADQYSPQLQNNQSINDLFHLKGSDLVLYKDSSNLWTTDIKQFRNPTPEVKDCFKLSAIKNIATGQEYIAEGEIYTTGKTYWDSSISAGVLFRQLVYVPDVNLNNFTYGTGYSYGDYYNGIYIPFSGMVNFNGEVDCAEFELCIEESANGDKYHVVVKNDISGYTAKVIEASGVLANAEICYSPTGFVYVKYNMSAGSTGQMNISLAVKGSNRMSIGFNQTNISQQSQLTPLSISSVGFTVDANNLGVVDQYLGATDANYTNGYFYKAVGTQVTTPEAVTVSNVPSGYTVTVNPVNFLSDLAADTGWDEQTLLTDFGWDWYINVEFESGEQPTITSIFGDSGEVELGSSVIAHFTITRDDTSESGEAELEVSITDTPSQTTIQDGHWERVNVQPAGATIDDTSTSSLTATWSANKLYTTIGDIETLLSQI